MVTQLSYFKAIRSGAFVPFPHRHTTRNIQAQLMETVQGLYDKDLAELLLCLLTESTDFPKSLTPKERLFYRSFITQ